MGSFSILPDTQTETDRRPVAARQAAQQQLVTVAVAEELNLLLRGKPTSPSVLRRAKGLYADLRDTLLSHDAGPARKTAYQQWLSGHQGGPDWSAAADVARQVADARNSYRQKVREAVALRKAQRDQDRAADFFGGPAALRLPGHHTQTQTETATDPLTFLTTLKVRTEKGQSSEWVYFCPLTKGKSDPEGLEKLARRYARQLEWEGQVRFLVKGGDRSTGAVNLDRKEGGRVLRQLVLTSEGDWKKLSAKWRQTKKRTGQAVAYQVYRQEDGSVVVCHDSETAGGVQLPADLPDLVRLTRSLLSGMADDNRVRTSAAFGGPFQGSRGDGQAKAAARRAKKGEDVQVQLVGQYVTQGSPGKGLRHAADLLQVRLSQGGRGKGQVAHEDALLLMLEAGYTMRPRKSHRDSLSVFDLLVGGQQDSEGTDLSHLVYIETPEDICTLSVTDPDLSDQQLVLLEGGLTW